jgi:hypothetical protein
VTERVDLEALEAMRARLEPRPYHATVAVCLCVVCEDRERFMTAAVNALPALLLALNAALTKEPA